MNKTTALIVFVICMGIVYFERSLPWLLFGNRKMPKTIDRLANLLPSALMATLVVYGLKSVPSADSHTILMTLIASVCTVGIHLYKKNTILSVFLGTFIYVVLLNYF